MEPPEEWPMTMDIFDPKAKCEKCKGEEIATVYCRHPLPDKTSPKIKEHLHRQCKRCGFNWVEKCLNSEQDISVIDLKEEKR